MTTVSVVIPYYNRQSFIVECVGSVFGQTRPADEILVVNDASDPEQRRYLDRFLPRVRIIDLPLNRGVSAARNAGIRAAVGEWIAFQDSDDVWTTDKLAIQLDYLSSHPDCDGVHTAIRTFYPDGHAAVSGSIPLHLTLEDALYDNLIRAQSLVIRASVLRAIGGFNEALRVCEDDDLGIRLALAGYRIDFVSEPLTNMRRGDHSHLFGQWRTIIGGKTKVALLHRDLLERVGGRGATRRRIARAVRKAGEGRGGVFGRVLRLGGLAFGGAETRFV